MDTIKCNQIIEVTLNTGNSALSNKFDADVICFRASLRPPVDDVVKDEVEELKKIKGSKKKLAFIVETSGGYVETVERIVSVLRTHYEHVAFIIPNYAYSAGTILVLSGDEIYMDYYSVLGPIDPQIENEDGNLVPGLAYLSKFEELTETINAGASPAAVRAELQYLIHKFDPGTLFSIEQSIEHAKSLLRDWLPRYKFKTWVKRETSGRVVRPIARQRRAEKIADILGNAKHWHSHGRGIGIKDLSGDQIKLKIENYGQDQNLYNHISHYHGLFIDYMQKRGMNAAIHSQRGLRRLG